MARCVRSRVTNVRTILICHAMLVGSVRGSSAASAGGVNSRPLIQPVTRPTMSFRPCFSAKAHRTSKRPSISDETPARPASSGGGGASPRRISTGAPCCARSKVIG